MTIHKRLSLLRYLANRWECPGKNNIIVVLVNTSILNGRDVQRKNVVNNVDKSSLWVPSNYRFCT